MAHGHKVDIIINTKDILEELVIEEGWQYTNLFPNTRKIKMSMFTLLHLLTYLLLFIGYGNLHEVKNMVCLSEIFLPFLEE